MFPLNGKQVVSCAGERGFLIPKTFKKNSQHLPTEGKSLGSPFPHYYVALNLEYQLKSCFKEDKWRIMC